MLLPFEIIEKIANYCNFNVKLRFFLFNNYFYDQLRINNLYTKLKLFCTYYYEIKTIEEPNISYKLNKNILNKLQYIISLNIKNNNFINDEHLKKLKKLKILYANSKISDK